MTNATKLGVCLCLLLFGCDGATSDSGVDAGPRACAYTTYDACDADTRCGSQYAYVADNPRQGNRFAACVLRQQLCDDPDALTCAAAPDGELWVLLATCVPPGWKQRDAHACDDDGLPHCRELDGQACEAAAPWCATIHGTSDYDAGVWDLALGCMSLEMGCDDAITCAHAADGDEVYWFSSSCIPRGWVEVECASAILRES